ncbi:MAG: sulfotransferase domain-containing protein [Nitrosomonadales bacterium]|nr:sulfotransferase domain-containing protein [Nitrosomonadales bacterium]
MHKDSPTIFFVVGASKSGTSSINEYLEQHPAINMVKHKDVACYFCNDYGMPITLEEYRGMLFPDGTYNATGDCCHAYLTDEHSASWIHSEFPNAKIIIILRNPADRAFSQYHWLVAHGYEFAETFEEALRMEDDRYMRNVRKQADLIQGYKDNYLYFRSGLYSQQVRRYIDLFPRENILFIRFDDLRQNSAAVVSRVYSFVGVDAAELPALKIYNERVEPYSIRRQYFIRRYLSKILPWRLVNQLLKWNLKKTVHSKFNPETRYRLQVDFGEDVKKTQQLTGLDLSNWLVK